MEGCTVADTGEVGAAADVSVMLKSLNKDDNVQRSTSAVGDGCLETSESTVINRLARDPNSGYECQNEEVKRTSSEHDDGVKVRTRCPRDFFFPRYTPYKVLGFRRLYNGSHAGHESIAIYFWRRNGET